MKKTLIIVADLGLLRAYLETQNAGDRHPHLERVEELKLQSAHEKMSDQVTDQAGRFISNCWRRSTLKRGPRLFRHWPRTSPRPTHKSWPDISPAPLREPAMTNPSTPPNTDTVKHDNDMPPKVVRVIHPRTRYGQQLSPRTSPSRDAVSPPKF